MCGRYWIDDQDEIIAKFVSKIAGKNPGVKTSGEIFPGDSVPVICRSRGGSVKPFAMEWGFSLSGGKKLINARIETADQKPMFRESMQNRRCLLPMSAYFEWEKAGNGKKKHRILPEINGLFCLAGLYRYENDAPKCTVLTMEAADEIKFIHPRMPVLIPWEHAGNYLRGEKPAYQMKMKFQPEYNDLPLLDL